MNAPINLLSLILAFSVPAAALDYQKPDPKISRIVEAESFPTTRISNQKTHILKGYYNIIPPIDYVAREKLRLAGLRFIPRNRSKYTRYFYTRFEILNLKTKKTHALKFPKDVRARFPVWSPDSKRFVAAVETEDCVALWQGKTNRSKVKRIPGLCLNTVMGGGHKWLDNRRVLVRMRSDAGVKPQSHYIAKGPTISETTGKIAQNRTYQDLLEDKNDEALFKFYTTVQLAIVDVVSGKISPIGPAGIITAYSLSPDKTMLRVHRIREPYSYVVPYYHFAQDIELWELNGKSFHRLARLPVFDSIPIHGVPTGKRDFQWIPNEPSTLLYAEALDQGDWNIDVSHREQISLIKIDGAAVGTPRKLQKLVHRYSGTKWLEDGSEFLLYDYERDRKWLRALKADYRKIRPGAALTALWSYSYQDDYKKPGRIVTIPNKFDRRVSAVVREENRRWIFTYDKGATPKGDFPYLKKIALDNGEEKELFRSPEGTYERFVSFADKSYRGIITRRETANQSPDLFIVDLESKSSQQLTHEQNPAAVFSQVKKELITWKRGDGTQLSGMLYYPVDYKKGQKYPTVVSAYPIEYTSKKLAGQVRGSSNKYSKPYKADYLYFTLKGYALLKRAQMPIVGHPKTMNDSLIEQLNMNSQSIRKVLTEKGISDPDRIGIIGHSYGAFMVANVLSHSPVFKTGIARSGAYNRSLTPFGFQSERRPFWKAKETYIKVSPFFSADKIEKPILLIHGAIDNNSGTHTMQSKRYYAALKGNGVTSRLVLLPHESHGYSAVETVNHVLWEMIRWFDLHL
ncbi:MAG: prolyl oligopeptidase [Elusimicrobia bacterium]|nr:MAG: prolyl oligopeptidase [Elusimicrobiota bacterium]